VGTSKKIEPDPLYKDTPNTPSSDNQPTSNVLLPGLPGAMGSKSIERYVLGPAQMTGSSIQSASVEKLSGQWAVSYQLTPSGGVAWNSFAKRQFHALIAIVANGEVYSAPIIQPDSATFNSFGRSGLITGNFTKTEARYLANLM
jgi:preprotein translocase subunit SecD